MNTAKTIQSIVDSVRRDFRPLLSDDSINVFLTIATEPNLNAREISSKLDLGKREIDAAVACLMIAFSVRFSTTGLIYMNQDGTYEVTKTGKKITQGLNYIYAA